MKDQMPSAVTLACGGTAAALAFLTAVRSGWDTSVPFLFGTLAVVAFAAAGLMLLPQLVRRVAVSFLLLYHFAGILCAVASAPPQSWLAHQCYEILFRPYLQAVDLTDPYHYYSPDPDAATVLWFRLEYESDADGKRYTRWLKPAQLGPDGWPLDEDATGSVRRLPRTEYVRRLALAKYATWAAEAPTDFETYRRRRLQAGEARGIPPQPNRSLDRQYREPIPAGKLRLSMYVRHVARTYKHTERPDKPVTAVKVYAVEHQILYPAEVAAGRPFDDPTSFHPYYLGEYEPDGTLRKSCRDLGFDADGHRVERQRDPFLYFLIPIVADETPDGRRVRNYFRIHAGDAEDDGLP